MILQDVIQVKKQIELSDLSVAAIAIMQYLIDRTNKARECFPAVPTIARHCHVAERTVQRKIKELVEKGFITKIEQFRKNNSQTSNLYIVNVDGNNDDERKANYTLDTPKSQQDSFIAEVIYPFGRVDEIGQNSCQEIEQMGAENIIKELEQDVYQDSNMKSLMENHETVRQYDTPTEPHSFIKESSESSVESANSKGIEELCAKVCDLVIKMYPLLGWMNLKALQGQLRGLKYGFNVCTFRYKMLCPKIVYVTQAWLKSQLLNLSGLNAGYG